MKFCAKQADGNAIAVLAKTGVCPVSSYAFQDCDHPPPPAWAMLNPLQQNDITETNNRSNAGIRDEAAHVNTPSTIRGEGKVGSNAGEMLISAWLKRLRLLLGNTSPMTVFVVFSEGPCKQQLETTLDKPQQQRLKK